MGTIEKNILKQAKRFGDPIPERILNKPRLGIGLDFFLESFFDLESEREWLSGNGAVPLPIRWSAIHSYALFHELTGDLYDDLLYFIKELDAVYMRHLSKVKG